MLTLNNVISRSILRLSQDLSSWPLIVISLTTQNIQSDFMYRYVRNDDCKTEQSLNDKCLMVTLA